MNGNDPGWHDDAYRLRPSRRTALPPLILGLALALMVAAGIRYGVGLANSSNPTVSPRPITPRGNLTEGEKRTIGIFERCSKSVVYVSPMVTRVRRSLLGYEDELVKTGTGSGFIWDEKGHVVTNFHVVAGADNFVVTLPDNSNYEAEPVGEWADKDIAVLRIDAPKEKLIPIAVGTSSDLQVGQEVLAIGNPFGLDFTLTTGVVSALNREIQSLTGRTIQGVIQTDAAINPGNSGGPLLDSAGRLIGINTAIYSQSGSSAGIGFAVPVDTVSDAVPQIIAHGRVIRPGLGVNIADDRLAQRLGLNGVLILNVVPGSGAEKAGLKGTMQSRTGRVILGDVIVKVGDHATPDADTLLNIIEKYEIGESVPVTVRRQGETITVSVTLHAME